MPETSHPLVESLGPNGNRGQRQMDAQSSVVNVSRTLPETPKRRGKIDWELQERQKHKRELQRALVDSTWELGFAIAAEGSVKI